MNLLRKAIDIIENIQIKLGAIAFTTFFLAICIQVVTRYVLNVSAVWAFSLATSSFIWMVFLGAAVLVRRQEHFAIDVFIEGFTGKTLLIIKVFSHILVIAVGLVLIVDGLTVTQTFWDWTIHGLPILKQGYIRLALPVSGITIIIYSIQNIVDSYLFYRNGGEGNLID